MTDDTPILLAGLPGRNLSLYRRIRFDVHDPVVFIAIPGEGSTLILRDIETRPGARAAPARTSCADPAAFAPAGGLSGDRATATAQSGRRSASGARA
jgi:hypothetical protein